jgi:dipeptidyl aminopeptidase/acylaminoacyl peptidase
VKDIKACVDYITRAGVADPKRVGIVAGSYGGYIGIDELGPANWGSTAR